ncbi:MAG TPA: hypothetical protein VH044_10520 [Polyangiaceae bacterium]|jgi:hypothetical protein|nr:hypothetical protein [Polyangiaceae bacterium]
MKTNRFAATVVRNERRSPSFRVLGGFACAMITALVAGTASASAPANDTVPTLTTAQLQTLTRFSLKFNPKFEQCVAEYPNDPTRPPTVDVAVLRGSQNDVLGLLGQNIKPNLKFDMFTIEKDPFNADGSANAAFTNFGFAWYQSDLEANSKGVMKGVIKTIVLDQIFGFDPVTPVGPTNTFEVGFWFNDPNDAAACGFDVTKPTPFNGEHKAGPLAAISLPDATTGLGPLCTNPDTSVSPARCNP